jgi:type IV secretion system protein VirB6
MIEWIGAQFINTITPYTGDVVAYLMQFLSPLALTLLTIGFATRGFATLRGATSEPFAELMWEGFCKLLIVAMATNAVLYREWVINTQNTLTLQVAQQFAPEGSPMRIAANTWAVLNAFNDRASELTAATFTEGVFSLQILVASIALVVFSLGNALLIAAGMVVCAITGAFNAFLLGIGPLFILFLLLGQIGRQWFVNWLGTLLGMAVLTWIMFFLLGFSLSLTEQVVATIVPHLGQINILTQSLIYLSMCLCWVVMLWVAPSFANGLTGGAGAQMGTQLLTQLLMVMRMGKGGNPPQSAGGSNTAGRSHGWGYRAGSAVGRMTGAAHAFQALAARGRSRPGP